MRRNAVIVAGLVLASVIVYAPLRHGEFISYDDDVYVSHNPLVLQGLTLTGVKWSLTTFRGGNWHPLTWLSHMLDAQVVGDSAGGHHLGNVLVHLASSIVLYFVLVRLTAAGPPSAWVALLFAVHPLHVESVAWVSERKDTLSTLLGLLAVWAYLRYVQRPTSWRYGAVLALMAASLMSKAMLVTLPFVLLLLDYWPLKRLGRRAVVEKLPMMALAAVFCVVTLFAQGFTGASSGRIALSARVSNSAITYVAYLRKTFVPIDLAIGYPHPAVLGERIALRDVVVACAVLFGVTALCWWQRRRRPWLIVGWLWYLGTLVPVIGIVQVGAQGMADRYTYVPLIGIFVMIGWTIWDIGGSTRAAGALRAGVATALVLACAVLARRQVMYWSDTITLFNHTLAVAPKSYIAHDCLGVAYSHANQPQRAMEHYRKSLALFPNNPQTHNNLGVLLYEQKQIPEAIGHYLISLENQPESPDTHNNLGNALVAAGRGDLAIEHYQAALRLDPSLPQAHTNLGLILAERGQMDQAIAHFRQAVRADPNYANPRYALALALAMRGDLREAIAQDRVAVAIRPDFVDALVHLAWNLATAADPALRNPEEAVEFAAQAVEASDGKSAKALDTLAVALAAAGRFDEAARSMEGALRVAEETKQPAPIIKSMRQRLELYRARARKE